MKNDNEVVPDAAPMKDAEPRLLVEKMKNAEMNPRAATDALKASGDAMAKKHGG